MTVVLMVLLAGAAADDKVDRKGQVEAARAVAAAVVEAGKANAKAARPLKGDELTEAYVRAAARAARKLPADRAAWGFAVGLGVAMDRSAAMRTNLLTRATWREVETEAERKARLDVLGEPGMHGRHDLGQHFWVSAALAALWDARRSEAAGVLKEWLDSSPGGSGFSFADLAADLAGIELASRLLARPASLAEVEKGWRVADHCPSPKGLEEGIARKEFEKRFGATDDARFVKELEAVRKRVKELPAYRGK